MEMSHFYLMYGNVLRKLYHSYAYFTIAIEYCKALGLCSALIAIVQGESIFYCTCTSTGVAVSYCTWTSTGVAVSYWTCTSTGVAVFYCTCTSTGVTVIYCTCSLLVKHYSTVHVQVLV